MGGEKRGRRAKGGGVYAFWEGFLRSRKKMGVREENKRNVNVKMGPR